MHANELDVVFVGGGLSAALAALALEARRRELSLAIVERGATLGGNHTWCFHAADLPPEAERFVAPLIVQRWDGYTVRFPGRARRLASPYACITSARLHEVVAARFAHGRARRLYLGRAATDVRADRVTLADGEVLRARLVVDATGPSATDSPAQCGYQKFVGLEMQVDPAPSVPTEPVLFDACIPQHDGFRFMYTLPFARDRLLIEETFFSEASALQEDESVRAILAYASAQGLRVRDVTRVERGVLPMPWRDDGFRIGTPLAAGYRAGLFHPVTGYSFPLAVRFALALAASDLGQLAQSPLARFARAHAAQRPFLRLLTRLLFRGFSPGERFRVLEHFYRLPAPLIERFYAAELSALDRARIFLGAPPRGFSVGRALGLPQGRA